MPTELRIATFNLEDFGARSGRSEPSAPRIAALRPPLAALQADVLCLQEVNAQRPAPKQPRTLHALDDLLDGTPYRHYHRVSTTNPAGTGPSDIHNLVVLSRFPIIEHRQIHHHLVAPVPYRPATALPPPERPVELRWDRPLLAATVAVGGHRLHVINLHLRAPLATSVAGQKRNAHRWRSVGGWAEGFFLAALKRSGQALEARLLVETIFDREAAALIAVCGDYNADAAEMPTRILRGDPGDTETPALAARRLVPLDGLVPAERRHSVVFGGRRLMLDHLLVSPSLATACSDAAILNDGLPDERADPDPGHAGSFHAPMVAAFRLP